MELISVDKPYDGMKAKLGDVVYARRDKDEGTAPPQEVVYVGEKAFVVESSGGGLNIYNKTTAGTYLFSKENVLVVNGFEVPAPLEADPGEGQEVYAADPMHAEWHFQLANTKIAITHRARVIARGLAYDTAAAAIARAKAMAGVDPTAQKPLDDAYDNLP